MSQLRRRPNLTPKKGRRRAGALDPEFLPALLETAVDALYSHYDKTFVQWRDAEIETPPVFIVVCNNTATSKLLYDYLSGYRRPGADGSPGPWRGGLGLFRNYDETGTRRPRPRTLLIDSEQIESGDALDRTFREAATDQIERFRRDIVDRGGTRQGLFRPDRARSQARRLICWTGPRLEGARVLVSEIGEPIRH